MAASRCPLGTCDGTAAHRRRRVRGRDQVGDPAPAAPGPLGRKAAGGPPAILAPRAGEGLDCAQVAIHALADSALGQVAWVVAAGLGLLTIMILVASAWGIHAFRRHFQAHGLG